MCRGCKRWAERSSQRAVSPSSFFGKCFHDGPRIQHVPSPVEGTSLLDFIDWVNLLSVSGVSPVFLCPVQLQSLPSEPHYLDGFEVLYRSLLPATSDWAAKKVSRPSFQAQVGPLRRGYKYEFKVRPYGSSLYGRESNTRHLRVPETGITRPFVPPLLVGWSACKTAVTVCPSCSAQRSAADCVCHSQPRTERHHPSELGASSAWRPQRHHPGIRGSAAELVSYSFG